VIIAVLGQQIPGLEDTGVSSLALLYFQQYKLKLTVSSYIN